jgi:hypothetical protein
LSKHPPKSHETFSLNTIVAANIFCLELELRQKDVDLDYALSFRHFRKMSGIFLLILLGEMFSIKLMPMPMSGRVEGER